MCLRVVSDQESTVHTTLRVGAEEGHNYVDGTLERPYTNLVHGFVCILLSLALTILKSHVM